MRRRMFSVCLMTLAASGLFRLPEAFAGGPYRGTVIDAESKDPLVGAVALAYWLVQAMLPGHPEDFLDAEEVLTDSKGQFVLGMNPPRSWIPGTRVSDPYIIIFRPGYGFFPYHHTNPPRPPTGYKGLLQMMEKENIVIELPGLKTRAERIDVVRTVDPLVVPQQKIPHFVRH